MLRWMTPILVAMSAVGTAAAQDTPGAPRPTDSPATSRPADAPPAAKPSPPSEPNDGAAAPIDFPARPEQRQPASLPPRPVAITVKAVRQLPPGLPRPHYAYRTTVASPTPPRCTCAAGARWSSRRRYRRVYGQAGVIPFPFAPGMSTGHRCYRAPRRCPAITGPPIPTPTRPLLWWPVYAPWERLPYACGVFGYCYAGKNGSDSTWQGHRGEPARPAPPTRPRRILSLCSSPSPTASPRS